MYLLPIASLCLALVATAAPLPSEIVLVEDLVSEQQSNVALITLSESGSSEEEEQQQASDDLIFPTHKAPATATITKDVSHSEEVEEDEQESEEEEQQRAVPPIDMSAFLALIPTQQVQALVNKYYDQDREVQRASVYLRSEQFMQQWQQQLQLPEVQAFLRYFNASGLDLLKLGSAIKHAILPSRNPFEGQDLDKVWAELSSQPAPPAQGEQQLNGLQGLVDSVLEVLPQDQMLATFFDKIEADQQFSKLIDSIGTPKFSRILQNLQNSKALRLQIEHMQSLHFNINHIVDSLKSYFFLSGF